MSVVVVLDQACSRLADTIATAAPVAVFEREGEFVTESECAAQQLHTYLTAHGLEGRAVYVAPSFAAFTGLLLADRFPGVLAALVLVDPSHPAQGEAAMRILEKEPKSEVIDYLKRILSGFGPAWDESRAKVARVQSLGSLPLRVLAAGKFDVCEGLPWRIQKILVEDRHAMLASYTRLSRDSVFYIIHEAGHDIAGQMPTKVSDIVISLVRDLAVRPPNQAPEPTIMTVTASAPSSTSRASHDRGSA